MARHTLATPRRGMRDWMVQRFTALYLAVYIVFIATCVIWLPSRYAVWTHFFHNFIVMLMSVFAVAAIVWHAYIGMWTVITDYVKINLLRILCKIIVLAVLFTTFVWGTLLFILLYLSA